MRQIGCEWDAGGSTSWSMCKSRLHALAGLALVVGEHHLLAIPRRLDESDGHGTLEHGDPLGHVDAPQLIAGARLPVMGAPHLDVPVQGPAVRRIVHRVERRAIARAFGQMQSVDANRFRSAHGTGYARSRLSEFRLPSKPVAYARIVECLAPHDQFSLNQPSVATIPRTRH